MSGAILISGGLGFAGSVGSDLISSDGDWSSVNWKKAAIMGAVNAILGFCSGAGSQNSKELGKGLLKIKKYIKLFLHYIKQQTNMQQAPFQNVGLLTAINLLKLGASTAFSTLIGARF